MQGKGHGAKAMAHSKTSTVRKSLGCLASVDLTTTSCVVSILAISDQEHKLIRRMNLYLFFVGLGNIAFLNELKCDCEHYQCNYVTELCHSLAGRCGG